MLLKNHLTIVFVFMLLIIFSACRQQAEDISKLSEGSWTISRIISNSATPPPTVLIDAKVTFANGGVEIIGLCNQMGGFYEINEVGEVTRSEVHMTLMDCDSMDEQEVILLRYFQESTQLLFDGEHLIMQGLQGEIHFVKNIE